MKIISTTIFLFAYLTISVFAQSAGDNSMLRVKVAGGILEGVEESGIYTFKGVPFAAPPVGDLRWKEPQPIKSWDGVRKADKFAPRAMQLPLYSDMNFRSDGMSEDCLYLNVWTPAKTANEHLPVLVYFYGGGLVTGDGSEPRYDGENMARQGIVAVTINYRLGIFGFFSHPELTKESAHQTSGNYGFMDQNAALKWVAKNISSFGGDPSRVTIAGESAGSFSVSAQMASPLSKNLFAGAIGESGSLLGLRPPVSRAEAEKSGIQFANREGKKSLAELRAVSAADLLSATSKPDTPRFSAIIDGYFLPESPADIFVAGRQSQIPLLVGWNSEESNFRAITGDAPPTKENYTNAVKKYYPDQAVEILKVYDAPTDAEVEQIATDLAGDSFIGFGTWKWSDLQSRTGGKPVYRYLFSRPRPAFRSDNNSANKNLPLSKGAVHSAEIEYALGNLPTNRVYDWQPEDFKISEVMRAYFANFIKTGNPNGFGLPVWSPVKKDASAMVMNIDVESSQEQEKHRDRYLFLDKSIRQ